MPISVLFAASLQAVSLVTAPVDPTSPEAEAVLVPVNAVFAGLAAKDGALITPHLDPEARMIAVVVRADGSQVIRRMTGAEFAGGLRPGGPALEELMPDPLVAIDGDVATVFGRYVLRVDGVVSHCGSNHFDMIRRDGDWTIAGITWNQTTVGCGG